MGQEGMNEKKLERGDLTTGSVGKKMIAFAIPLAIASLVQALYNLADMAIVGQYIGSAGMSAVTMGGLVANVVLAVINGFGSGGAIYIGQLYGANKKDQLKSVIGTMITSFVILALVITGLLLLFNRMLLTALKTPEESIEQAVTYLAIYISGTIFVYVYNVLAAVLRGLGKSMPSMVAVVVTAALNVGLDLLFIGQFRMGVAGAAVATIISQFISVIIIAVYIKRTELFDFRPSSFKVNGTHLKNLLRIGFPQALQFALTNISFLFISGFVNQYGVFASAASGATTKFWTFEIIPGQAVQMAIMTLTAQNITCGKFDRIRRGLLIGIAIAFVSGAVFWAAGHFFPQSILSIFTTDQGVLDVGARYMQIFVISGLIENVMFCFYGIISGSGHTVYTFMCAVLSAIVVRISFVWMFDSFTTLGFDGIAWAYVCAPAASFLAAFIYVLSGKWKKPRIKV